MSELKRCPFCSIPLKLVGSKRRGNQHYLPEYNNNCILNGFGFIATGENIIIYIPLAVIMIGILGVGIYSIKK